MRACLLALALVLVLAGTAPAQTSSGSSSQPGSPQDPPTEIAGKTVKQWMKELRDRDPSVRQNALRTVPYFGKGSRDAVPYVLEALRDPDASCRVYAAMGLMSMVETMRNDDVPGAVQALGRRLNEDTQAIVRFYLAIALSMFGPDARPAIPNLASQVRDPASWEIRRAVVVALSSAAADRANGPDPRAIIAITGLFSSNNYEYSSQVRQEAVMALGALGRPNQAAELARALQALAIAQKDPDKGVSIWAHVSTMALDKVTDDGLAAVAKHLKGKDTNAKMNAARALAAMGKDAKGKIPDVVSLLQDKDPFAVAAAVSALGEFGPYAYAATGALKELSENKNQPEGLRDMAKEAIKRINADPIKKPDAGKRDRG